MKAIAWLAGVATLVAAAAYMVVSLNRWEWSRTLFFGLVVLIAEVGLATGVVLRRLEHLKSSTPRVDQETLATLRATRSPSPDRFAWLKETTSQLNVFITFLVAGGVVVSALAWVVDRVATNTSTPLGEDRLAARLGAIGYPRGGLVVDDVTVLAQDVPGADDVQIAKLLRRASHS
jgi:hypothetical protein